MIENDNDELSELTLKTIRTAKYAIIQKLRNNDKN